MVVMHLAKAGLKPLVLFGGATGAIGDPSGRSTERTLLSREQIDANVAAQSAQASTIFQRAGITLEFINNIDWLGKLTVIDFLRDTGKHFPVSYMLNKDFVAQRVHGEGISYTEFSYMALQATDFNYLHKNRSCRLQIGGSDQWGNITAGLELIRRTYAHESSSAEAFAFSVPLILRSDGKKFGKSESGAVWLDGTMLSPYKFHQYWLNTPDADCKRYLSIFTMLTEAEISAIISASSAAPEKRIAQNRLADEVTTLVHGSQATAEARRSAEVLFGGSLAGLNKIQIEDIFGDVPSTAISHDKIAALTVGDLFVESKLSPSKGEMRRLFQGGGAYLNNERLNDPAQPIAKEQYAENSLMVLRSGKKNYHLIKVV
jgi:tyrosyl-tRNA synthetase